MVRAGGGLTMGLSTLLDRVRGRLERRADAPIRVFVPAAPARVAAPGDDALRVLRRAVARAPEDPRASLALARGLERAGLADEALRTARSAAHLARRRGDQVLELEACRLWAGLDPSAAEAAIALAAALAASGHAAEAAEAYERVIAAHGARVDLLLALGSVYDEMARAEDAFDACSRAVSLEPENADALIRAGIAARALGRADAGEALLERALRVSGPSHAIFGLVPAAVRRAGEPAPAGVAPRAAGQSSL